jgi:outer membrane receptor for ferric coprogen and ferric-rhodotorulic acid
MAGAASPVWAAVDSNVQHYDIPPAPLGTALNRLGQQAHLLLSFPNDLIAGQSSQGLRGDYTVDEALQALLAGSQLVAVRQPDGRYVIERAQASGALELQSISISGKAPGSTTEGTGLYTTYSSSSSTRLNLTPRKHRKR